MKPWVKVFLVTVLFAVPAMALGQIIWSSAEGGAEHTTGQISFLIVLSAAEIVTFAWASRSYSSASRRCCVRWTARS